MRVTLRFAVIVIMRVAEAMIVVMRVIVSRFVRMRVANIRRMRIDQVTPWQGQLRFNPCNHAVEPFSAAEVREEKRPLAAHAL